MSMKIEETVYFELNDGRTVFVKDLDADMQKEVVLLDRLRQDVVDKTYEMQVFMIALDTKKNTIQKSLMEFLQKKKEAEQAAESKEA